MAFPRSAYLQVGDALLQLFNADAALLAGLVLRLHDRGHERQGECATSGSQTVQTLASRFRSVFSESREVLAASSSAFSRFRAAASPWIAVSSRCRAAHGKGAGVTVVRSRMLACEFHSIPSALVLEDARFSIWRQRQAEGGQVRKPARGHSHLGKPLLQVLQMAVLRAELLKLA